MTPPSPATPTAGAYAPVNGLDLYYEQYGDPADARPLVLLHGGVLSIGLSFAPLLAALAEHHRIIAVDLQGHGRTADPGRPMTLPALADDIAGLLDHLGVARADLFGVSLGGFVALELAVTRPQCVGRAVLGSIPYHADGYLPEVHPKTFRRDSDRMPTAEDFAAWKAEYERVAPDPGAFESLAAKASALVGDLAGWSAGATVEHRLHGMTDADYAQAADDLADAVAAVRADPRADEQRLALWFFSGAGLLAADWLAAPPPWLRCLAAAYPLLAARANLGPAGARFRPAAAVREAGRLPIVLTRVALEHEPIAAGVARFLEAARDSRAEIEVIDVPGGHHGFETVDHTAPARDAVTAAVRRVLHHLQAPDRAPTPRD